MFQQKTILLVKGNEDRLFRFECDPTSQLGEVHDALETMKAFVVEEIKKNSVPLDEKCEDGKTECSEKCSDECEEEKE